MSDLLERIQKEIRERLEASREAVREHERLEAALHALGDAGTRATRAVRTRRPGASAPAPSPVAPAETSAGPPGPVSDAAAAAAAPAAKPARATKPRAAAKRAPRGANRDAVLRVIGERPGVTTRELAAASSVSGSTLYSLLRRLAQEGTIEKRELPGGQTGYALASSESGSDAPEPAPAA
jgi:hypothetical protein